MRGLIRWYRRSGDERMLALCRGLARFVMLSEFWGDVAELDPSYGAPRGQWWGHFYANLAALRGLLEDALAAEDWRALSFVGDGYEWARHRRPIHMQCCTANGNQGFSLAWDAATRSGNVSGAEPVLYPAFPGPETRAEGTPTARVPDRVVPRPIAWM